eukprot:CAMPEP_0170058802 /NCGR_PEP_ID=MMETSP0019_2-20121128/1289_1 /TAXON_ID=98059 /ORGANISM="Dinobryon sp., Strain UTEXLB2267" /LENGTH=376 /DNA_ID=CAMNT_0010263835 /DNA_START=354 /DNA_END=1484 /DNA_ORIENTATION=+
MDSWNDKQIRMMKVGGNDKCIKFLKQYNVEKNVPIPQKYNSPAALLYRDRIAAEVEGKPLPTELPAAKQTNQAASGVVQGSDPLPGESEADYVARQRLLQNEARERMRQKFGGSSGLSSSGKMQGIGSDPNYGQNKDVGGIAIPPIDYAQIGEASQKAFSYVTTSLAVLGDQVSKVAIKPAGEGSAAGAGATWGVLGDMWTKASEVTGDIVKIINTKDLEDDVFYKFPRPVAANTPPLPPTTSSASMSREGSGSTLASKGSSNALSNAAANRRRGSKNDDEWDDLDDLLNKPAPVVAESPSRESSKNVSRSGSQNGLPQLSVPASAGTSIPVPSPAVRSESGGSSARTTASTASSKSKKLPVDNPAGDDFFATFGV